MCKPLRDVGSSNNSLTRSLGGECPVRARIKCILIFVSIGWRRSAAEVISQSVIHRAKTNIPNIRIFVRNNQTNIRSFPNECSFEF